MTIKLQYTPLMCKTEAALQDDINRLSALAMSPQRKQEIMGLQIKALRTRSEHLSDDNFRRALWSIRNLEKQILGMYV